MRAHVVWITMLALWCAPGCGTVKDSSPDGGTGGDAADPAVCGDGVVAGAEECDDGNTTPGDGCDAFCRLDHVCIITHDGGSPARISSLNLAPTGQFTQLRTLPLGDNDLPQAGDPRGFAAIAACGRHVYAAMDTSNVIAHVELDASGGPTARASTPLADVHSLVCDDTRPLLLALTGARTPAASTVTSFAIGPDGALTMKDSMPVVFGAGNSTLSSLLAVAHPKTDDLWIIGYSSGGGGGGGSSGYRVTVAADGTLSLAQGPTDVGGVDFGNQVVIRPDATLMVMAGLSGGCTGAWRLPATGVLPGPADRITACSGNFSNGNHVALRPASTFFYHSTGAGALRVSEVSLTGAGTLVDHGTMAAGTGDLHLALAYDGSILVSVDAATGSVKAYTIGTNEIALSPTGSQTAPSGTRGLAVARCGR